MKKIRFLLPILVTFVIVGIIYYFNGIYPFGNHPLVQVDADYLYIPTLYRIYDFLHFGRSIIYSDIGLGNSIFGSLIIQASLFSPLNLLLFFVKRSNIINFMAVLILIKLCLISLTSFFYIDKRYNIKLIYKILFSILYTFNGFIILNYFNDIWLDIVILFPIVVYSLGELLKNNKYYLYTISLSLCFIISIYYSVFIIIFIIFYSFIYIHFYGKNIRKTVFLLGKCTVIALFISSFSSIPCLYQIFNSDRFSDTGGTNIFSDITMKSLYLLMSPFFIIMFFKLIGKYKKDKKHVYTYFLIFLLYFIPVLVNPINVLLHGGSYWSFPYRYGFIMSFILMDGSLYYFSKYYKNKDYGFNIMDILFGMFAILFGSVCIYMNIQNRKEIIDEGILLDLKDDIYIKIIIMILCVFVMYILSLFIKSKVFRNSLIFITSLVGIFVFSSWTIYYNSGYFLCTNAMKVYNGSKLNNMDFPRDGRYRVEYTTYSPDFGFILDVNTLDNWVHILPKGQSDVYEKLGYHKSGSSVYSHGGTIFTDYFLNFKYLFSEDKKEDDMFTYLNIYDRKFLYQYNYNIPNAFVISDINVPVSSSRFEYQNNIYKSLFNTDKDIVNYKFFEIDDNKYMELEYNLKEESYAYFNTYYYDNIDYILINDEKYIYNFENYIKYLGFFKGKINIKIYLKEFKYSNFDIGFIKKYDIINLDSKVEYRDNVYYVKDATEDDYLFIPVNNIKGIHVYNNGKEIPSLKYLDNFILVKLSNGENKISFKYELPLFKIGIIFSIIGIILFIINKKIVGNKLIFNISYYAFNGLVILAYLYYYLYSLFRNGM